MSRNSANKFNLSLFVFRRDLRVYDNSGLKNALNQSKEVLPCFFLEDHYLDPGNNKFYRPNALQFLLESLLELNEKLQSLGSKLFVFKGDLYEKFGLLVLNQKIEAVYLNEDYSPYSQIRDKKLKQICESKNVLFFNHFDQLLYSPGSVENQSGKPYKVFTSFYKKVLKNYVNKPDYNIKDNFYNGQINNCIDLNIVFDSIQKNEFLAQRGGRKQAVNILKNITNFDNYSEERDIPSLDKTTRLSAHIKFGTISIREIYWKVRSDLGLNHTLITELIWREFYYHLGWFFPHVFKESFLEKYKDLEWENDKEKFIKWTQGNTGFPIVDAGMRQLNKTGWMHNRVRMIVASFLVKDLHIDWRWGEQYFREKLVDYDLFSNNGGWQWSASTGADSQPYFRIFNPWLQQKRFDPESIYIKKWVDELKDIDPKKINKLYELEVENYPKPIVDHKVEAEIAKIYYKELTV